METQSQCCALGQYYNEARSEMTGNVIGCVNCAPGYVSKFGEQFCNACGRFNLFLDPNTTAIETY